jgi:hypothetical protein
MEENQEGTTSIIENLALITDAMQTVFPNGKMICVYELNDEDYKSVQKHFRKIDHFHNKFSVDISGLEHVFINESVMGEVTEEKPQEKTDEPKKEKPTSLVGKMSSWFERGGGSVE